MTGPVALAAALDAGVAARPRARFDPIEVRAFETRTGRVVARVPYVGTPTWSFGVNDPGEWRVQAKLGGDGIDKVTLDGITDPWRFSWAISQGSRIWQAGPVVTEDYNDGDNTTTVGGGGLLKLLTDKRILINPARASLSGVTAQDADILFGPTGYVPTIGGTIPAANQNLSLHSIFRRILEILVTAAGGDLPLVLPDVIAGTSAREYPGYELAGAGQRLLELSQVISGPEFEFAPEFADPQTKQSIRWRARIGNPNLGNLDFPHFWDQDKALLGTGFTKDGGVRTTRDFERGNGMNRDLVTGFADAPLTANPSDILLETVGSGHTSAGDTAVLNGWAQAAVANGASDAPIFTHRVRVPGDDGNGNKTRSPSLTEVAAGDNGMFVLKNHPRIQDGTYACRIIRGTNGNVDQTALLTTQLLGKVAA
jgi:hypothetical protein